MGIVVVGAIFVDIKGYPLSVYIPQGRNVGKVEHIHGGVSRNVAEDIANVELRPTFVSLVDNNSIGEDVVRKLKNHKVNTSYIKALPDGMGTWLAVFDNQGDVVASISKRPDLLPLVPVLEQYGDDIFKDCDSIVVEIDIDREITRWVYFYAAKYNKKVYAVVSNMGLAIKRRDLIQGSDCFVCNIQEAGMFFSDQYDEFTPEEMAEILFKNIKASNIKRMVVTMGGKGAVYADATTGEYGVAHAHKVEVVDTTGAGDAFFSGVTIGLTYGKSLKDACRIGTRLASSVICTHENVCPRFLPQEFDIDIEVK